ncbi:amino acid adenylation domain-containing protein [Bacillus rhizoplanae]|uniref:amino acid adenylation domain-containing protein n=1 Tax=Bacillus rhizoplanae TaxID=2880966 RepID=UPI003D21B80B
MESLIDISEQYWKSIVQREYERLPIADVYEDSRGRKERFTFDVDKSLHQTMNRLSGGNDIIIFIIMLAAYKIVIERLCDTNRFIVGIPPYLQNKDNGTSHVFLLSDNSTISGESTVKDMLGEEKKALNQLYKHQFYPLDHLYKINNVSGKVNTFIGMRNLHHDHSLQQILNLDHNNMTVFFENKPETLTVEFHVDATVSSDRWKVWMDTYQNVLSNMLENTNQRIEEIEMIDEVQKEQILIQFNDTKFNYPKKKSIVCLFEEQVAQNPGRPAVSYGNITLTYAELNAKANMFARMLQAKGMQEEAVVAFLTESSIEMIIGIFGTLKAGGTYLPIDPQYPMDRIEYMLADGKAQILVVRDEQNLNLAQDLKIKRINLEDLSVYKNENSNLDLDVRFDQLAYIIYTSGTTGKPKGVMVEHQALVNLCCWHNHYFDVNETDVAGKYAGVGFDASVWEIFPYLIAGAEVRIIPEEIRFDAEQLNSYYDQHGITIGFLPTVMFERFIKYENRSLKRLITGGDKLKFIQKKSYELYNNFGPSEYTVVTSSFKIDCMYDNIPIGKPVHNTKVYILSKSNQVMPIGVPGELCVSGDGIARGYLHNEELTNEKFQDNPFEKGSRMYRTGDLARWLPDGNIEFLGRIDHQVQIRGYRVELGEIESNLLKIEGIQDAIVINKEKNGDEYLCSYYISQTEYSVQELREHLLTNLPDYMIPLYFIKLDQMPLTPNGKVDRKALPEPTEDIGTGRAYVAPRNEREEKLVDIWSKILGVNRVGIQDDFFELGGHSLTAAKLLAHIHEQFEVVVPLKELFTLRSIESLSEYIASQDTTSFNTIEKVERQEFYQASSAQKRMYLMQQLDQNNVAYNVPGAIEIRGRLDYEKLNSTLCQMIERHEVLRTIFSTIDGMVVQKIVPMESVDFTVERMTAVDDKEAEMLMARFIRPFNLQTNIPIRAAVIQLEEKRQFLLLDMHHIIADGTTAGILIEEFSAIYSGQELEPLELQYKDYSSWQLKHRESNEMKEQEAYWLSELEGELPLLSLPTDYTRPQEKDYRGDRVHVTLSSMTTEGLKWIAKDSGSTLYMVLLAGIKILLSRYSGQEDIIVGSPIAGRNHRDVESMMGVFVNTLAIRSKVDGELPFTQYLQTIKQKTLHALEHQEYQFEDLVEKLDIERSLNRNPLFDVMFAFQNMEMGEWNVQGLTFKQYDLSHQSEKFDLTWDVTEQNGQIEIVLSYATSLFTRETIEKMTVHFIRILEGIVDNSTIPINQIEMISEGEKQKVLKEFNSLKSEYARHQTIHELFEHQVERTPNNVAIRFNDKTLTYQELNKKANALASTLRRKGIVPDSLVAILLDRSVEMIVGILAILKAGGAYLPIDPEHPRERIEYILQNSNAKFLLTDRTEEMTTIETLNINDNQLYCTETDNLKAVATPHHLAYVIYTSGTTGNPKGVAVQHKGVMNTLHHLQRCYPLHVEDRYLFKTNYTFDVSVSELFGWFFEGGQLVILPKGLEKEPTQLVEAVVSNRITHVNFTSSMFNAFISVVEENSIEKLQSLKYVITAGEVLKFEHIGKVKRLMKVAAIENLYGPTEATIYATAYSVKAEDIGNPIPIGKPISNCRMYIIDSANQPVPIGVAGELCIAGEGLAKGYFGNEELTQKKFIADPFVDGQKMYLTGDLAKWRPDGNIEYLGRIDHQVKIRGYRIELGEIENCLMKLNGMQKVMVIDKERAGNKFLIAYYVTSIPYSIGELRDELRKTLPNYMIPSYFMELEEFPLNSSGKIDRKALPEDVGNIHTGIEYVAPGNEKEEMLVHVWESVLGINKVSVLDDFFNLGGDSIKAMQVVSKIKEKGYHVEVKDIFLSLTIKELSKCLKQQVFSDEQGSVVGKVELTPIQTWFFNSNFTQHHHWNQAVMLYKQGGFREELLAAVFERIITHHDALRMSFAVDEENQIVQSNKGTDGKLFDLQVHDFRYEVSGDIDRRITEISSRIQASIDLQEGPLLKLGLFKKEEGDHLLIAIHHLVIDGVSWRILLEDLSRAYKQAEKGDTIVFPRKSMSYKKWAGELKEYANGRKLAKEVEYWQQVENSEIRQLKRDRTTDSVFRRKTAHVVIDLLSVKETEKLLQKANAAYNTEINDLLLSALVGTIAEFSGDNTVLINLEGHGREEVVVNSNISRTIGWFTTQYPVVFNCDLQRHLASRIVNVKDHLRRIPNKGIGYGLLRYLWERQMEKQLDFMLNPEVIFNYLGQFDADLDTGVFELSSVSHGDSISKESEVDHALDFTGMVVDKRLKMSLTYNTEEYEEQTMVRLLRRYMEQLREIINHCTAVEVPIRTISDITKEPIMENELQTYVGKLENIQAIYSLVPMQKGMMFHSLMHGQTETYHESLIIHLEGELDLQVLGDSFQKLIDRHEMLRTNFDSTSFQETMQIVYKTKKAQLEYWDISKDDINAQTYVENKIKEDRMRGFDLKEDLLIRLTLVKTEDRHYSLIISNHHIIMDGWSTGIVLSELFQLYHQLKTGRGHNLEKPSSFSDFVEWINNKDDKKGKAYWDQYLKGFKEPTQLPFRVAQAPQVYANCKYVLKIPNEKVERLEEIAIKYKVTLNTVIQALWSLQLQKYNGTQDSVFGFVVSGRNQEVKDIDKMVGLFINTIPLRVNNTGIKTFIELVQQINGDVLNSRDYDDYPLADMQVLSEVNGELFNHIMVFENFPIDTYRINACLKETGMQILHFEVIEQTSYDFNIIVSREKDLLIRFSFNENQISEENVRMIARHFENLVEGIARDESVNIEDLDMIRDDEKIKEIEQMIEEQLQNSTHQFDFNF